MRACLWPDSERNDPGARIANNLVAAARVSHRVARKAVSFTPFLGGVALDCRKSAVRVARLGDNVLSRKNVFELIKGM